MKIASTLVKGTIKQAQNKINPELIFFIERKASLFRYFV